MPDALLQDLVYSLLLITQKMTMTLLNIYKNGISASNPQLREFAVKK